MGGTCSTHKGRRDKQEALRFWSENLKGKDHLNSRLVAYATQLHGEWSGGAALSAAALQVCSLWCHVPL
jgi:hypothetical protein